MTSELVNAMLSLDLSWLTGHGYVGDGVASKHSGKWQRDQDS